MKVTGAAHMIGHLQSPCCGELCLAGMSCGCRGDVDIRIRIIRSHFEEFQAHSAPRAVDRRGLLFI